jgi:hypothetical protein
VNQSSRNIKIPKALAAGSRARDERIETALSGFVPQLKAFLGGGSISVTQASKHMDSIPEWTNTMTRLRLTRYGGFAKAVDVMGAFVISGAPKQKTIRALAPVVKRRITGKTKQ